MSSFILRSGTVREAILIYFAPREAGLEMGGLGIQPIENTVQGFQQNLLQKIYRRVNQPANGSLLPRVLNKLLLRVHRPSVEDHVERMGPQQWNLTAMRLEPKNKMFAQAFRRLVHCFKYMKWTQMGGIMPPSMATPKLACSIRSPWQKRNCYGDEIL
jgi:hypothetical protein